MVKNKKFLDGKEHWSLIPNTDYQYEVSTYGRVRKICQGKTTKLIRSYEGKDGQMKVTLSVDGSRRGINVARLVADAFLKREGKCLKATTIKGNNCHVKNVQWVKPNKENIPRRAGRLYVLIVNGKEKGIYQSITAMAMNSKYSISELEMVLSNQLHIEGVKVERYEPAE